MDNSIQSRDQVKAPALVRAVGFAPSFELAMARMDPLIAAGHGADDVSILAIDVLKH